MKTRFLGLCVATLLIGCTSSAPSRNHGTGTAGSGSTGTAGSGSTGTAGTGTTAGTAGDNGAAGTGTTTGTAGDNGAAGTGTTAGTAGTTTGTAGAAGSAAGAGGTGTGTAGAGGAAGAAGAAGTAGAAGSGTGGAAGANQVPGTYTGKPFMNMAASIPGMIQIEDYDTGGANVAYKASGNVHGSTCGFTRTDLIGLQCTGQAGSPKDQTQGTCAALTGDVYLGYIGTGDWMNYTVNVKEAGTYAISTHVGVNGGNTKLMFTFTPTMKTDALALMGTSGCGVESYHVWATENIGTIALQPGTYVMRLDFVAAGLNIDWVAFTKM